MKNFLNNLLRVVLTILISIATMIGVVIDAGISLLYVGAHILRYWWLRGIRRVLVSIGVELYWVEKWNENVSEMVKKDNEKSYKISCLRIDD